MLSAIEIIASGFTIAGSLSPIMGEEEWASTITRKPICAYCFTILSTLVGRGFNTNSGAPITNVPTSAKDTAESLRFEEKGIFAVGESASQCPK